VLNRDQIALIHREIDGANTPEERSAFRALMEQNTEASELAAELRDVARLCDLVEERAPPATDNPRRAAPAGAVEHRIGGNDPT
jgi:anti-sigma factor RsiW